MIVVDARVSRRHVTLEPGPDDSVVVTDLDSANGTTVDGVALKGSAPAYMGSARSHR